MWAPWLIANFNLHRPDIVNDNITISEIIAMWDSVKASSG